jgi:hypothetical protein
LRGLEGGADEGGEAWHVGYLRRVAVGRAGINALTMQIRYGALRKAHP